MTKSFLAVSVWVSGLTCAVWAGPDAPVKFQSGSISDVLVEYSKLTGKKVLCDNTVQGQISVVASSEEGADRKIETIEKAMFLNGFSLIDAGEDTVEVVGLGKPVRALALPLYTKPDELPTNQRVFSYLFKLEHRDAREVAGLLTQYSPPSSMTSILPDRGSHAVIITGQTSFVRAMLKLVPALDVPTEAAPKAVDDNR